MQKRAGKLAALEAGIVRNQQVAQIILLNPQRYSGLLLEWAERIRDKYGLDVQPYPEPEYLTFEERLSAEMSKSEERSLGRKRKRWELREWRRSRKGNVYTNAFGMHIVVYYSHTGYRAGKWSVLVEDEQRNVTVSPPKCYPTEAEARAAAFDAMVMMQAQRQMIAHASEQWVRW